MTKFRDKFSVDPIKDARLDARFRDEITKVIMEQSNGSLNEPKISQLDKYLGSMARQHRGNTTNYSANDKPVEVESIRETKTQIAPVNIR